MDSSQIDWYEIAERIRQAHRPHAGYFTYECDKQIAECGVAVALAESLDADGCGFFEDVKSRGVGNDPPDCEATLLNGGRLGIEVTEIVYERSIQAAKSGSPTEWRPYSCEEIEDILRERISIKDRPSNLKGGPYDSYLLVLFTDEQRVLDHTLIEHIRTLRFQRCSLIDRAILLMSYSPWENKCPYIDLKFRGT